MGEEPSSQHGRPALYPGKAQVVIMTRYDLATLEARFRKTFGGKELNEGLPRGEGMSTQEWRTVEVQNPRRETVRLEPAVASKALQRPMDRKA